MQLQDPVRIHAGGHDKGSSIHPGKSGTGIQDAYDPFHRWLAFPAGVCHAWVSLAGYAADVIVCIHDLHRNHALKHDAVYYFLRNVRRDVCGGAAVALECHTDQA